MKKYNDEPMGFEAMLPAEIIELLTTNLPETKALSDTFDSPLDEHELAMAA